MDQPPTHPAVNRTCNLYWEPVLMCGIPPYWPPVQKVCAVSSPPYWHPVQKICVVSPLLVYTFSVRCPPPPQFSSVP